MSDRREEILRKNVHPSCIWEDARNLDNTPFDQVFNAMDENGKQMCLDILVFMANNNTLCESYLNEKNETVHRFFYKGKVYTKEELFQNFL